ncbi:MAG: sigma 54-interacting transcriptional regulator, partial [candidate division WOR-3 bacterium]
ALKHADSSGDLASRADALNNLGLLAWHRADFDQAIEYLTSALSLREELGTEHSIAATCNNLSLVYWERGDLTEALEFQQRSLGLKELIGDRYGIGVSQLNLGLIYVDLGDWDKALECYFRALAEKEQSGDKADIALCYNNIGELYLKRGRLDRASFYLEQALKLAKAAPSRWVESEVLGNLGECAFEQHNLSRALNCYQEDRRICLETDDKEELAETLRRWAELDLAQGQFESCRTRIGEALTLCEKTGARRELGNVHRLLGELAAKLGERAQARSELEQAVAIFRTIGKNYELARALTSLGLVLSEEPKGEGGAELSEALVILRNLGVEARARELEQLLGHGPEAPKQDFQMPAPLLSELVHLAATSSELDQFCAQALNLITRELPIPGAAIVLRNGRVFQIDDTGNRQTTTITLALELNRLRLGTLVVSLGTDALADTSLVHQKQLAPLAELVALGIFHAQSQPAPLPSRTQPILDRLPKIIGAETTLREVFDTIRQVAPTRANVLILGESGTGKELVARTLHELSDRKDGPFVVVNCAAIPETLLESELFGIEKGTATGVTERKGRFEAASGGTVFLDEIGDMSLGLQAKLLRVLQDRTFERVGGRKPITADVRIIAATNRNLEAAASQGLFRPDLYYRLSVITITLPALRIRKPDIPELVAHFVTRFSNEYGKRVQGVTQDCLACLCSYEWPGNVRELENVLERAVILSRTELLTIDDLPPNIQRRMAEAGAQGTGWRETRRTAREQAEAHLEMDAIRTALEHSGWVIKRAAQQLGISRRHLYRLMHKHNIRRPERQGA